MTGVSKYVDYILCLNIPTFCQFHIDSYGDARHIRRGCV